MSKTHRKQPDSQPMRPPKPSRKQQVHEALAQQDQQSRGVEFPQPEAPQPKRDW